MAIIKGKNPRRFVFKDEKGEELVLQPNKFLEVPKALAEELVNKFPNEVEMASQASVAPAGDEKELVKAHKAELAELVNAHKEELEEHGKVHGELLAEKEKELEELRAELDALKADDKGSEKGKK